MKNFLKKIWKWFLGTLNNYPGSDEVYAIELEKELERLDAERRRKK